MKSVLVIGMGKFGHYLVRSLAKSGNQIMIVDKDETKMTDLLDVATSAKIADCTKREVLSTFGVEEFDRCVVSVTDDFQSSLEITDLLIELGARHVTALAATDIQEKFLYRIGAQRVIHPDRDIANRLAIKLSHDSVLDYISVSGDFSIYELVPPRKWVGHSIAELKVRAKWRITILAVRQGEAVVMPDAEYRFKPDDQMIVMGHEEDIRRLIQ